ncbi:hypothetical protein DFO68_1011 [Halomonas ventosae]|uniref:Uncharacterized protein n=1 Tax=Halomonas ventosae TaxID=229007 RepID=A0A4R6I6U1_9GAMM|nr:hypothetical protein DFO68_1011 [Halomonas ventosae]
MVLFFELSVTSFIMLYTMFLALALNSPESMEKEAVKSRDHKTHLSDE